MRGDRDSNPVSTVRNRKLRRRFTVTVEVFFVVVIALWLTYQKMVFDYIRRSATESMNLTESHLLAALDDEFSGMSRASSLIAGDSAVQTFLAEKDTIKRYEQSKDVAAIIRKAAYSYLSEYTILTGNIDGSFFQFIGSVSDDAIDVIENEVISGGAPYTVLELDGNEYFCLVNPAYRRVNGVSSPVGYVVALSDLTKVRRVLTKLDRPTGIDTAVILDGVILFSSNPSLDGKTADEIEKRYGSVTKQPITDSNLIVASAVDNDVLRYGERLFISVSLAALLVMAVVVAVMYRWLSLKMVAPMLQSADEMQMGLLKLQISAHFVINTITCIRGLSEKGENEKAAHASELLAGMLKTIHEMDEESGVYVQLKNLERFIGIMNIRHDDKFMVDIDIDDRLSGYKMLGQILQPLAENALLHGFSQKTEDCLLTVKGRIDGGFLLFEVTDNGIGMPLPQIAALQDTLDTASDWDYDEYRVKGVALINIQKRVHAKYGSKYGLTVTGFPGGGMTFTVRLPLIREE